MADSTGPQNAIEEWIALLGIERTLVDEESLKTYARSTQDKGTKPCCILFPTSTEEVCSIVRIANEHGVVVYPISRGHNWGYGDRCAPSSGSAIVDLSRMNKIAELNTELGYAVIEPGVSQEQLYEYLSDKSCGYCFDCSGAGKNSSILGNTLDRGFGHTPYGDHFQTCAGLEIVLPDARVLNTGFGHYANAKATSVFRYGVGPFLDGIFCQSNFGIVTKMTLWLMPEPEAFNFFAIRLANDSHLAPLIEKLRGLRMQGTLRSAVHIGNDLRVISGIRRYPWEKTGGETPLPQRVREELRRETGTSIWTAAGSLSGTKGQVRAARKELRRAVGAMAKVVFLDDFRISLLEKAVAFLNRFGVAKGLSKTFKTLKPNYGLLKGIPTDQPLMGAQWRLRNAPAEATDEEPGDPLGHGCGLMWVSPVLPMTGEDANRVMDLTRPIFEKWGFDQLVTFTLLNERAMICIMNVSFDKSEEGETDKAMACYDALMDSLIADGYYPYRVGLRGMEKLWNADDVFWQLAGQLKQTLDPNDIMSRGRYFRRTDK